jgi:hypothetical protein
MERRSFVIGGLAICLAPLSGRAEAPPDLVARLRQGGFNLYFRHSLTKRANQPDDDLTSCAEQRNLTEDGVALAREIGQHIRALRLPIGEVLASPYCRCVDTARWAFDRVAVADWLESNGDPRSASEQQRLQRLKTALTSRPPAGLNAVFVAHGFNLIGLSRLHDWPSLPIAEGEAAIFEPTGVAIPPVLARVKGTEWRNFAAT